MLYTPSRIKARYRCLYVDIIIFFNYIEKENVKDIEKY